MKPSIPLLDDLARAGRAGNLGLYAVAFGGAVALYLYSRTDRGETAIADTADTIGEAASSFSEEVANVVSSVTSAVRGIRNNNPGNIRKSATAWQGLAPAQTDSAFFQFVSMPYGIRAMVKILRTYQQAYGLDTVRKIISRWAPPNENDTGAYIAAVARRVNVFADTPIDVNDGGTIFALVRAIIAHENGAAAALLVSDETVFQGIELA